ncbi:MAG: ABC transporter permease [Actinomycetia bacterium]|nr:ABC transporter permease [Actinomycetes bacterium]MCP5031627.1 ABC transporter permease [Actinomycetes bacterium]
MIEYIIRRVLSGILVLFLLSTVLFFVMRLVPGDVVRLQLADAGSVTPERMAEIEAQLGLDKPALSQYGTWLSGVVRGDLGESLWEQRPVGEMIRQRFPVTFELALLSIVIAVTLGILAGVGSAIKRGSSADNLLRVGSVVGLSIPNFFLALLMITAMSLWFNWVAPLGYQRPNENLWVNLQQMAMPSLALGLGVAAAIARMTRSSMLEVLGADYIRTVRSKGVGEPKVNFKHALRNSMVPIITLIGLQFGALLGGTVILESIFGLPGIGSLVFRAVEQRDYPVIQAAGVLYGGIFVSVNIAVDITYGWIDPRIRRS